MKIARHSLSGVDDLGQPLERPELDHAGALVAYKALGAPGSIAVVTALRCELFPPDVAGAADFYERVLAFRVVDDRRDTDDPYVALERDAVRLGLAQRTDVPDRGKRRPPVGVELVLDVDDVDVERARVAASGWPVVEDVVLRKWGLRDFRLLDPAGYYWRLTSA